MIPFQVCAACLDTGGKMFKITKGEFLKIFLSLSGLKNTEMNYMPEYLCHICLAQIRKFLKFRKKCAEVHKIILDVLKRDQTFTIDAMHEVNKKDYGIKPFLSYMHPEKSVLIFIEDLPIVPEVRGPYAILKPVNLPPNASFQNNNGMQKILICNKAVTSNKVAPINNNKENKEIFDINDKIDLCENENIKNDVLLTDNNNMEEFELLIVGDEDNISFDGNGTAKEGMFSVDALDESNMNNADNVMQDAIDNNGLMSSNTEVSKDHVEHEKIKKRPVLQNSKQKESQFRLSKYFHVTKMPIEEQIEQIHKRKETEEYINAKYKCEFCFRTTQNEFAYKNHMRVHDKKLSGKFQCQACRKCHPKQSLLHGHYMRSHAFKFQCKTCDITFYNTSAAARHCRIEHRTKDRKCETCNTTFTSEYSHELHLRSYHATESCYVCGESFVNRRGVTIHMHHVHGQKLALFTKKHKAMIDPKDPHRCVTCRVRFKNEIEFARHMHFKCGHTVESLKLFNSQYKIVGESEKQDEQQVTDESRSTEDASDSLHCDQCNIKFLNKTAFDRHVVTNSNHTQKQNGAPKMRRNYECGVCGDRLVGYRVFEQHFLELHPDEPLPTLYVCEVCGKGFRKANILAGHMRTHAARKAFACAFCGDHFTLKVNMKRHVLRRHMVVPTTKLAYQCGHCPFNSVQKRAMNVHVRTTHLNTRRVTIKRVNETEDCED